MAQTALRRPLAVRVSRPDWLTVIAVVGAALLAALAGSVGSNPILPLIVVGGAVLLVVAYLKPLWVVALGMVVIPLEGFVAGTLIGPTQAVLGTAAAGWIIRWATTRPIRLPAHPLFVPFALLIFANVMGLFLADQPSVVFKQVVTWGTTLIVAAAVAESRGGKPVERILFGLALSGGIAGLMAIVYPQPLTGTIFGGGDVTRVTAGLGSPNVLGGLIALTIPFQLVFILRGPKLWRMVALGCLGLSLAGMSLAVSRGAFIGLGAALMVLLVWRPFRTAALIVVPAVLVIAIAGDNPVSAKLDNQQVIKRLNESGGGESESLRVELWRATPRMIEDKPIFGVGALEYGHATPKYHIPSSQGTAPHAHDTLLTIAAELGLFGLSAFLALLFFTYAALVRVGRRATGMDQALGLAIAASLTGLMVSGILDYLLGSAVVSSSFFTMIGCAAALAIGVKHREASGAVPA
jgi:O-antigen ligase